MTPQAIETGFEVFASDHDRPFGAVVRLKPHIVIYVENAGEFPLAPSAITSVHDQKVIVDRAKLDKALQSAIAHAHDAEDDKDHPSS